MRVFAIFHGAGYAPNHGAENTEVHASVIAAIDSLRERYRANGRRTIDLTYADGHTDETYWPGVDEGDSLTLWRAPSAGTLDTWARHDTVGVADYVDESGGRHVGAAALEAYKRDALAHAAEEAIGLHTPVGVIEVTARGAIRRAQRA